MDKELPIWFLYIDGVINALADDAAELGPEYQKGTAAGFPIFWRPSVVGFINEVHRQGIAEIHWLTTWGEQARTGFAPLVGLDDFPNAHGPGEYHERGLWWKTAIVKKFTDGGRRPFVFTMTIWTMANNWIYKTLPLRKLRCCCGLTSLKV